MIRALTFAAILFATKLSAEDGNFLNVAILELPDRYLADLSRKERPLFLLALSERGADPRLDYNRGWLHWYSDGHDVRLTSMLYLKLLRRKDDTPLVFVHMPKPFADGSPPRRNQTFVLERDGDEWRDVTNTLIPKEVDLTMHFRPRRSAEVIEVGPYKRQKRANGRGYSYSFGERKLDLVWDGSAFDTQPSKTSVFSNNRL